MPKEDPNAELSRQSYWDARYDTTSAPTGEEKTKAESFDWLKDFSFVRGFLEKYLPPSSDESGDSGEGAGPAILHLGNGNSVGLISFL